MAKQTVTKEVTKGTCRFCNSEFEKSKMTQHLKFCKQRAANIKTENSKEAQKSKLFHLVVEGRYLPEYWMHLEMPTSALLEDLDGFLRDTWLECCDHLSAFTINKVSYSSQREELLWDFGEQDDESEEEEKADEDEEEEDEDAELALSEAGAEFADLPVSEVASRLIELLSREFQIDLAHLSPDEVEAKLTDLLTEKLQAEQGAPVSPEMRAQIQLMTRFLQPDLLADLATGAYDEHYMDVELGKALKVGQKFFHEYDFGSTTELALRVVGEREGVVPVDEDGDPLAVFVMARNEPPIIPCRACGKPATQVFTGYYYVGDGAVCDACRKTEPRGEYEDSTLPIVNSPRVGVCGYTGSDYTPEWGEMDEEEYEEDEEDEEDEEEE